MTAALMLTVLAGAATVLGGFVAVHPRVRMDGGLAVALGFAAGAMILVSLAEIVPKGARSLTPLAGPVGAWAATLALAAVGSAAVVLLQRRLQVTVPLATDLPAGGGPGDPGEGTGKTVVDRQRVLRSGTVVAVAVAAHNIPEGLVTFVAALDDPRTGAAIAVAIALHNIPEGVAVAAPVYGATGSRRKALLYAGLSGLAEPVGAVVGYAVLAALLPEAAYGLVFGLIAGVMLHISLTELLPSAWRLSPGWRPVSAVTLGAVTMVASLVLFRVL